MKRVPQKPPKNKVERMDFVSVRMPASMIRALEENGTKHERKLSAEVRVAIRHYLEHIEREAA